MPPAVGFLFLLSLLVVIWVLVYRLFHVPQGPATRLHLHFKRHRNRMAFNPGQSQLLTVVANGDGVETNVAVVASDTNVATVTPTADPTVFRVDFLTVGHVDFTATAQNSVGATISGSISVDVVLPAADALTLTFSDVV